ncbi:MAG: hypothetical protein E2576_02560 [Alcaligenaceae bacterium]|nr:hypothetical protein [Alcaligenaceae bacterium SAGV5]MPS54988.1 hypothetical protein [Alcaligenaceae bacterium SAGV3]MPT55582.1 hypothetical protein [Alcaligenaceae bacterium]
MTHERALEIIERAQRDKYLAREVDELREKCGQFIGDLMHEVGQEIAAKERKIPVLLRNREESAISLRSAAAHREQRARERRELAEAVVMGALFNSGNPDWDPLDPATYETDRGGLLMALLKTTRKWVE